MTIRTILAAFAILAASGQVFSQEKSIGDLPWQTSPTVGQMAAVASVELKDGLYFLGEAGTKEFLVMNENPARDDEYTLAPESLRWFAIFDYDESGYVKDDEEIDAGALLAALKDGNKESISERQAQGLPILYLDGWAVKPHYDQSSNLLEWGVKFHDQDNVEVVNYTVRLLGRSGVMSAILVSDPLNLEEDVRDFHTALAGFSFIPGQRYAEFQPGDKLAEYGLGALIIGGAAAAAAKSGFLKPLLIGLFAAGAAVVGAIGTFFRRIFRRSPPA